MQHVVDGARHVDVVGDVAAHEPERRVLHQVLDVVRAAGEEVVQAQHLVSEGEQAFAQVGAEEAGSSGDDGAWHAGTLRCLRDVDCRSLGAGRRTSAAGCVHSETAGEGERDAVEDVVLARDDLRDAGGPDDLAQHEGARGDHVDPARDA